MFRFLFLLFFFSSSAFSSVLKIDSEVAKLRDIAVMVSTLIDTPIFISEGVDADITVFNNHLRSEDALWFLEKIVVGSGFDFSLERDAVFITLPAQNTSDLEQVDSAIMLTRHYVVDHANLSDIKVALDSVFESWSKSGNRLPHDVSVSVSANALLVTTTEYRHAHVQQIVQALDVDVRQVKIEALIFETSNLEFEAFGFDLRLLDDDGFSLSYGLADQLTVLAKGVGIGYSSQGTIKGVLTALQTDNSTEILSAPVLRVVDRQQSRIEVGQEIPFIVSRAEADDGRIVNQIIRRTVGLTLSVRPVIDNDTVRLEISTTAGSLSGDSTAADVITNNRSITTTVTAKDGELVYLGGLLQEDKKSNTTGVPVLQKVPFFGGLFGRDDDRLSKTKLSVFLKPTIL